MKQTKRRWTVGFLITAIFAFVTALSLGFGFVPSNETMTAHAETYHDQYIDRSTIQEGDVFYADTNMIHIFNDMHTTIQAGDHVEVVDWKISLKEDGVFTDSLEIGWDEELVVPFGKVYTYCGTYFEVTDVPGDWTVSGTTIVRVDRSTGILTVGSKTGYDATMDDYTDSIRPDWVRYSDVNAAITKIVILDKVTWIGDYCFTKLTNLETIEFGSSLSVIGSCAFKGCTKLETIAIPDTVVEMGSNVFADCTSLKNVTLSKNAGLGAGMFTNCTSLTDLDFLETVSNVPAGVFNGCSGLVDITIPNNVTTIGSGAFDGCSNLKKLKFSDNIQTISQNMCSNCANLEEVTIGSGTTFIDHYAFSTCPKLTRAVFNRPSEPGSHVTFAGRVNIPDNIYGVPFWENVNLYYAGEGRIALFINEGYIEEETNIYLNIQSRYYEKTLDWLDMDAVYTEYSGDCKVVGNWEGTVTISPRDDGNGDGSGRMADGDMRRGHMDTYAVVIEDGVTYIGAEAFTTNWVERITFGADVESIGARAFYADRVPQLNFPSKLKSIGWQAFFYNDVLTEINLPDSITTIAEEAFGNCNNVKGDITIPKTCTSIGVGAFPGGISNVYLERQSSNMDIDYRALNYKTVHLYGDGNAKLYRITDGEEIVDGGNMGATPLRNIGYRWRIPADYDSGDCIVHFEGMHVTVTKNPNVSGNGEMADYANLEDRPWHDRIRDIMSIDVEDGVTKIGDRVFKGLGDEKLFDIKYINLPETGLKTIGDEAFKGYIGRLNMRFASSLTYIGNNAIGDRYFGNAIFICPDERKTLTLGENAFVGGYFGFERTGSMILYDDEFRIQDAFGFLDEHTSRTLLWRDELFKVVMNSSIMVKQLNGQESLFTFEDYNVNVIDKFNQNARDTQNAAVNDFVTVTLTPEEGYFVTNFNVYQRKIIGSVQEIVEALGNVEIVGNNDITLKVSGNKVILVKDDEIIFELTDDYSVGAAIRTDTLIDYVFTCNGKPTWTFGFAHNLLSAVNVDYNDFYFLRYGINSEISVSIKGEDIEFTKIDGNTYTFIMPNGWVTVESMIEVPKLPTINGIITNSTVTITSGGEEVTSAWEGDTITLNIETADNYVITDMEVFCIKPITSLDDLVAMMGSATFRGASRPNNFSNLICKLNDQGNFVVLNGNETVLELTGGTVTSNVNVFDNPMTGKSVNLDVNIQSSEYTWCFSIGPTGILNLIYVNNQEGEVFRGQGTGNGDYYPFDIVDSNVITEGKLYTFTMPEKDVFIRITATILHNINVETENGNINVANDKNPEKPIIEGNTVVLNIEPDSGYILKDIKAYSLSGRIRTIQQLVSLMGDAEFSSGQLICKVNEQGHFVIMNGNENVAELTDNPQISSKTYPTKNLTNLTATTSTHSWVFAIQNEVLISISCSLVSDGEQIFSAEGTGTGEMVGEVLALTTVVEGSKYTFKMPNYDVKIVATFEEHAIPEHDHDATTLELVPAKDATCEEAGNIAYYHCTVCGKYFSDANGENEITLQSTIIDALGHDYKDVVTAPTCTEKGYTTHTCSRCGGSYVDSYVDALGHTEVIDQAVAPTCTETGLTEGKHCSVCGEVIVAQEVVPAKGHTEVVDQAVAPTCTETGLTEGKHCSVCEEVIVAQEVVPALGHDYKDVVTDPTCTEQGYTTHTCSRCGDSYVDSYVDALGHTASEWIETLPPTCTEKGSKHKVCTVCGEELEVADVDALGHDFGDWIITKQPTMTEEGEKKHICTRCGEEEKEVMPIITCEHSLTKVNAVAPTCTEEGHSDYWYCELCDTYFADAEGQNVITLKATVIEPTGHTAGEWVETLAPTCTEKGSKHKVCTVCGEELDVADIDALGHDYQDVVTDPTCTEQGHTTHTCSRCGDSYVDSYVDALGHIAGEWIVTKEPTCTEKGSKHKLCTICGEEVEVADIDALGHDYQVVITAPTCTEQGYTTHTCSRCGDSYIDSYVDALGHTFGEWTVTKEAQVGVKGEETRICSVCGEKETREIPALPYVPTTTDDGEKVYAETVTEEAKDVTELFAQAKEEQGSVEIKATTDDNKEFVIVFDSNAVKAIGEANVTLSAKVVTENVEVENAELVLEVTLEGATFEGGEAKVSIPFEKEVPTGKVAKVYYIADDGTRTDMNATLVDGKIVFTTNHFSTYAVMFEDIPATGLSGWAIAGIVIGSVVLLLIIACAVLVILNKKGIIHLAFLDKKTKA